MLSAAATDHYDESLQTRSRRRNRKEDSQRHRGRSREGLLRHRILLVLENLLPEVRFRIAILGRAEESHCRNTNRKPEKLAIPWH